MKEPLRLRFIYAGLIVATVIAGLLSRSATKIPLFIGDVLWATMVFFIARFLFVRTTLKSAIVISLLFCYAIEFFQLYQAEWITHVRHTLFGRLVLGETFNWGDLLSYTAGVAIGVLIDSMAIPSTKKN